jgi:hypothetical protein
MDLSPGEIAKGAQAAGTAGWQAAHDLTSKVTHGMRAAAPDASAYGNKAQDMAYSAGASAQEAGNSVANAFYKTADWSEAGGGLAPVVSGINRLGDAAGTVGDAANSVLRGAGDFASSLGRKADKALTGAADTVGNVGSQVAKGLFDAGQSVANWAKDAGGSGDDGGQASSGIPGGADPTMAMNMVPEPDGNPGGMPGGMIVGGPDDPGMVGQGGQASSMSDPGSDAQTAPEASSGPAPGGSSDPGPSGGDGAGAAPDPAGGC